MKGDDIMKHPLHILHRKDVGYMDWRDTLLTLWIGRTILIRDYILSLARALQDLNFVTSRLLLNGAELARFFSYFYGFGITNTIEPLLTQHVLILSELITALSMESEIEPILARWYENNNAIIEIMILVNPKADSPTLREALNLQFQLELNLLQQMGMENYDEGFSTYDASYDNALRIANNLNEAITAQFQL